MVNLVDEALRGPLFERALACAPDVIVADPAVGTGTFLLGVLRRIAATVDGGSRRGRGARRDRGRGQAADRLRNAVRAVRGGAAAADRRIAALDDGEYAAAARASALHHRHARQSVHRGGAARRRSYEPVAKSRRDANKVKKEERITVVIGNPPYKEKAEGRGGWIEKGAGGKLVRRWTVGSRR